MSRERERKLHRVASFPCPHGFLSADATSWGLVFRPSNFCNSQNFSALNSGTALPGEFLSSTGETLGEGWRAITVWPPLPGRMVRPALVSFPTTLAGRSRISQALFVVPRQPEILPTGRRGCLRIVTWEYHGRAAGGRTLDAAGPAAFKRT